MVGQSNDLKRAAIASYVEYGTVTAACRAAGIGRTTWYDWKKADSDFAQAVADAEESVADKLEQEAIRRAMDSSDTMLIFLLKGLRPGRYADRQRLEHSGGPIKIDFGGMPRPGDDAE